MIDLTKAADLVSLSQPEVISIKRRKAEGGLTEEEKLPDSSKAENEEAPPSDEACTSGKGESPQIVKEIEAKRVEPRKRATSLEK